MRNFKQLNQARVNTEIGVIYLETGQEDEATPVVAMRREGSYIVISASYGPLEIALRPRFEEFTRVLARLQPVEGLQTTRQVGTGQAFLALGLQPNGVLLMRPTLVADATGHLAFNLSLSDSVRKALYDWLPVQPEQTAEA
ncbi:MAG: hypothetical protein BroJett038_15200 [Chloroflexota bacterium]|nr:MAG: hypothetical protein BroJett038_15200 [Chloroflexota bacterium]